jgi:ureidoglycolate lyase
LTAITIAPLTADAFAPFGDVIAIDPARGSFPINGSTTQRFHDLATAEATGSNARVVISLARATPFALPLELTVVERHPFGSQAFVPVVPTRFLVIVAPDEKGTPGTPRAFLAAPGQGINYRRGTWHGVLTALDGETDFIIIDREGREPNLEEFHYPEPWTIGP